MRLCDIVLDLRRKRRTDRTTPAENPIPVLTTALLMQRSVCLSCIGRSIEKQCHNHVSSLASLSTFGNDKLTFCEIISSEDTFVLDVDACCDAIVA